ncbi:acylphosphatase, partial [Methylobacterium sp. WL122]
GHVRNRADGAVEATFTGAAAAVDAMVQACRAGPPGAHVERVETQAAEPEPDVAGFAIRR